MRRHRFDPFSLLFGALFTGIGITYLLGSTISDTKRVVWPMVALIVGGTIVAWGISTTLREQRAATASEATVDLGVDEPEGPANGTRD